MGNLETLLETNDARTTEPLERARRPFLTIWSLNFRGMVNDAAAAAIARWRKLTWSGDDAEDAHAESHALQEAFLADDGESGADRSGHVAEPLGTWRGRCNVVSARWWT